jgi:hypothetical protein
MAKSAKSVEWFKLLAALEVHTGNEDEHFWLPIYDRIDPDVVGFSDTSPAKPVANAIRRAIRDLWADRVRG